MPVIGTALCKEIFRKHGALKYLHMNDMHLCAGLKSDQNAGAGDSGGPLMLPVRQNKTFVYYQIGVVSWGIPESKDGAPTVYSNTAYFAEWIQSML